MRREENRDPKLPAAMPHASPPLRTAVPTGAAPAGTALPVRPFPRAVQSSLVPRGSRSGSAAQPGPAARPAPLGAPPAPGLGRAVLTVQVLLLGAHHLVGRGLADGFGHGRAGDAVLRRRDAVGDRLPRHRGEAGRRERLPGEGRRGGVLGAPQPRAGRERGRSAVRPSVRRCRPRPGGKRPAPPCLPPRAAPRLSLSHFHSQTKWRRRRHQVTARPPRPAWAKLRAVRGCARGV